MMRIDLPATLKPGQQLVLNINWNFKLVDRSLLRGRGGYEYFPGDGNYLFSLTNWYPRLCLYSDYQGWQNRQFTGIGEFALAFGNFRVAMTVPSDQIIGATGECINYKDVLNPVQLSRYQKARNSKVPVDIVTLADARITEKAKEHTTKRTWVFQADNVRDFAWTASRKFIWDGMGIDVNGKKVMCMSFYGKEAYGLFHKFSTKLIAHTIRSFSSYTIPYPYPVGQSVEAAIGNEYPMICFNYGRTDTAGNYTEKIKNFVIFMISHSIGHNWFPEIINSDESQWTWFDEGLDCFVQYISNGLWDEEYPNNAGEPSATEYMKLPKDQLEPVMTNAENIRNPFVNTDVKVPAALNILRETILGRKRFDAAFKIYCQRWAFKHPTPADFFRTMQDASGEDLNWFWRGWFYSTDVVDISLDSVKVGKPDLTINGSDLAAFFNDPAYTGKLENPDITHNNISKMRNIKDKNIVFYTDADSAVRDIYWKYDRGLIKVDAAQVAQALKEQPIKNNLKEIALTNQDREKFLSKYFYELDFSNKGGLVSPLIVEFEFKDSTKIIDRIPADIWRQNEKRVSKFYSWEKEVVSVKLDPYLETGDINEGNNYKDKLPAPVKIRLYKAELTPTGEAAKRGQSIGVNLMQIMSKP